MVPDQYKKKKKTTLIIIYDRGNTFLNNVLTIPSHMDIIGLQPISISMSVTQHDHFADLDTTT